MKSFSTFLKEASSPSVQDVYIDLDGVLVDFHAGSAKVLKRAGVEPFQNQSSASTTDDDRWRIIDSINNFWNTLSSIPEGISLFKYVEHFTKPKILSAAPKSNFEQAKKEKTEWVKSHIGLSRVSDVHIVRRSQKKSFAINKNTNRANILIDDYSLNCQEWESAGGIAILYTSTEQAIRDLQKLGFKS